MIGPDWLPTEPDGGSAALGPEEWLRRRLFERRMVVLTGPLDDRRAGEVGASLMTLDASGDGAVDLQIDCAGGSTGAALALMDIVDLLGVPVRAWCTGQAAGPALGVLAVCAHRALSPHARVHLTEPRVEWEGSARQLEQLAAAHADQWTMFCRRVAEATGQDADRIGRDADRGRFLTAPEAVAYGLADEVVAPDARIERFPGRPIGFRPR
ncbi:MAG TPA: ATP-dependent Clp protease proteolytic subunit [Acidimicrobiales bacterium]